MERTDLSWRVEEACLNAWPSTRALLAGGWLARVSGDPTRRTNSVNPLRASSFDPGSILQDVRRLYRDVGQPLIFRVPSIAVGLDHALTQESFGAPEAETITLHAGLINAYHTTSVEMTDRPAQDWLEARAELNNANTATSAIYERMLSLVCCPVQFACVRDAGKIVAIAYGVLSRDLLVVESVATHSEARCRGVAKAIVSALMSWAKSQGVAEACLQVMSNNDAARCLYDDLGFTKELYRYHYRRS